MTADDERRLLWLMNRFAALLISDGPATPWFDLLDAARYLHVRDVLLKREIRAGRLRAIEVRRDRFLTRAEWCDAWVFAREGVAP